MNTSSDKCSTICLFDPSVRWNVTFWTPGGVCATCGWTPPQVSQGMVDFLNLTGSPPAAYLQAYCLNPPRDDACPFGYCSNPDIAGIPVRYSGESQIYVTNLCALILLFISPEDASKILWPWVVNYGYLFTGAIIALETGSLTRIHALLLISLLYCSPISLSVFYGFPLPRASREQTVQISSYLSSRHIFFWCLNWSQESCQNRPDLQGFKIDAAFVSVMIASVLGMAITLGLESKFRRVGLKAPHWWSMTGLFALGHFMIFIYWIFCVEYFLIHKTLPGDNEFTPTIGQIFAVFGSGPPIYVVVQIFGRHIIHNHRKGREPSAYLDRPYDWRGWIPSFIRPYISFRVVDCLRVTRYRDLQRWRKARDRPFNPPQAGRNDEEAGKARR
ncbi:hypothetical protein NLI96_g5788 [Meripilus lineatus]|uniref:Uncharacterized protein n=1 Tax=Meripilus lineatus TaxID=2056292 RepID=A0AAD5V2X4_9APHY|nr:hypothetical protein NLI96_g5788 [Physisporinus lineatus]